MVRLTPQKANKWTLCGEWVWEEQYQRQEDQKGSFCSAAGEKWCCLASGGALQWREELGYFAASACKGFSPSPLPYGPDSAMSTLQVCYQLWQKGRRHHLDSPCPQSHLFIPSHLGKSQSKRSLLGKRRRALGKGVLGLGYRKWGGGDPSPGGALGAGHLSFLSNCPVSLRTGEGRWTDFSLVSLTLPSTQFSRSLSDFCNLTISPRHPVSMSLSFKQKPEKEIARTTQLNPLASIQSLISLTEEGSLNKTLHAARALVY